MGSPTVHGDTIESLIRERRETEEEVRRLQKEIKRLSLEKDGAPDSAADEEIERLARLKKEKARKLTEICMVARTISAGD
jgi:predicted phage gp36 major capsid-like protein